MVPPTQTCSIERSSYNKRWFVILGVSVGGVGVGGVGVGGILECIIRLLHRHVGVGDVVVGGTNVFAKAFTTVLFHY